MLCEIKYKICIILTYNEELLIKYYYDHCFPVQSVRLH